MKVSGFWRRVLGKDATEVAFTQTYSTTAATVPAITSGAGTGADATTPSGAEHALAVDDITENRKLINQLIDLLQDAGQAT